MDENLKEAKHIFKAYFFKPTIVVIGLFCSFLMFYFNVFHESVTVGNSMEPTIHDGEFSFGIKMPYFTNIERGDIIVFKPTYAVKSEMGLPLNKDVIFGKRVIAVPGDVIEIDGDVFKLNGEVYIDEFTTGNNLLDRNNDGKKNIFSTKIHGILEEGEYFVMGDNRDESYDSRNFGIVHKSQIVSKTLFTIKKYTEENESRFVFH